MPSNDPIMRCFLLILAFTMVGCDRKQETAPASAAPPDNAVTGAPRLSGSVTYKLGDGEARHEESPETFEIPAADDRAAVTPGDWVKLVFEISDGTRTEIERMWVKVTGRKESAFEGVLDSDPYCTDELKSGEPVTFEARHIIQIEWADETAPKP